MKKATYEKILNVHVYTLFPACAIFTMYATGAAILQGKWMLLLYGAISIAVCAFISFALACKAD